MDRHVTVRATADNLRGAIPFDCEYLVVISLTLMFHGRKGSLLISDVPELDCPIIRSRQEEIVYALIELHLGDPFFVTLILQLESLFALT